MPSNRFLRLPLLLLSMSLLVGAPPAPAQTPAPARPATGEAGKVPIEELRRFVGIFNSVRDGYVDPVTDKALMESAIRGLLLNLDPHSVYLPREEAQSFDEDSEGRYGGVGIEVDEQPDGTIKVVAPFDDSPAKRAGLRSGDVIIAIDNIPLAPGVEARHPLRGAVGTQVKINVRRAGEAKPLEMTLTRAVIRVTSVTHRLLAPGYGYVRLSQFQSGTAADFQAALTALQAQGPLRGLVLDLRSNPGGLLTSAVQIADDLLERGTIVSTRGRLPSSDSTFTATPGDRLQGAPMVVIVDAGTASAAEVLSGALRDNRRARLIGSRTFGKGLVQSVMELPNGDAVKLTTARYYTPDGTSIQARGLQPDIVLKPASGSRPADVTEASLPGHLRGEGEQAEAVPAGDVLDGDEPIAAALAELRKAAGAAPRR